MFLSLLGGSSKLDILIATPGRLMDHLASTPNFTLQHLRFLVIDEADRLLNQSFQNWLTQVLAYTRPPVQPIPPSFKRKPDDTVSSAFMEACSLIDKDGEWCDSSPSIVCPVSTGRMQSLTQVLVPETPFFSDSHARPLQNCCSFFASSTVLHCSVFHCTCIANKCWRAVCITIFSVRKNAYCSSCPQAAQPYPSCSPL